MDLKKDAKMAELAAKMGQPQQPQITPDMVKTAKTLKCSCGGGIFLQGLVFKKLSPIISPTGEEMELPIQVFYCKDCGLIHPDTDQQGVIPEELKSKKLKLKI